MKNSKKFTSIEEVNDYANSFVNEKLKNFLDLKSLNTRNKGALGNLIQEQVFGISVNSKAEPDFLGMNLKLELKITPVKKLKGKGQYSAKERLVLGMINYQQIVEEPDFYTSHLFTKSEKIEIMNYVDDSNLITEEWPIKAAYLFDLVTLPTSELETMKTDYEFIRNKVMQGQAHLISESDTSILAACRKGAGQGKDLRAQPFSEEKANSRAFSLKPAYMTTLFYRHLNKKNLQKTQNEKNATEYLRALLNYINQHLVGINTYNYYSQTLGKTNHPKQMNKIVVNDLLKKYDSNYEFILDKFGYKIRTMTVNKHNKVQESFPLSNSLDNLDMQDLNYHFEDSEVYQQLVLTKYLIIPVKKIDKNLSTMTIKKPFEFYIDENDYQTMSNLKNVWEQTKECFINPTKKVKEMKIDKNGQQYYLIDFPKAKDKLGFHIRPKAKDSTDHYLIGNNQFNIVKSTFWVNKNVLDNYYSKELKVFNKIEEMKLIQLE